MATNGNRQPIGSLAIDTKQLVDRMTKTKPEELLTYEELSLLIGRNVQGVARGNLATARHICQKQYNIVFGVIPNVGIKHLNDIDTINTGQSSIDHIRRTARRAAHRIVSLKDPDAVPNDIKIRQFTYLSVAGALVHMTQNKQVKKLEGKISEGQKELPLAKTLEAFKE